MKTDKKSYLTDSDYKFIFSRVPRLCLDFVVVKDDKILLAKREIDPCKGCWSLPGGMVRYKESLNDAAERILKEELGLKSVERRLIGYVEFPDEINKNGVHIHSVSIVFLTKLEEGGITGSEQAQEVRFFESLPEEINQEQGKFLKRNWNSFISK